RNKMLGLWAAGILGKTGAEAEAYAKEVVLADFESGDKDVAHKVIKDLQPTGITEQQIRTQMAELLKEAVAQIKKRGWSVRLRSRQAPARGGNGLWCPGMLGSRRNVHARRLHCRRARCEHGLWDTTSLIAGVAALSQAESSPRCACRSTISPGFPA